MRKPRSSLGIVLVLLAHAAMAAGQNLDLPADKIPGEKPGTMMSRYWLGQTKQAAQRRQTDYEARKTPDAIAAYQKRLREKFVEAIGGLPERTPLNPQVTGTVRRDGYRVDKVIFESQPKHFVTALLFLPDAGRFKPPYPGVLVPCGHSKSGKGHPEYQSMGAFLASSGMAALVFDPIDQGERGQYLGEGGWPELWGTRAHSLVAIGSTLLGRNTAGFEIWDGMRAIDYLQSRPEVDPKRIGCTGNSGGGTQTSYLMALDDRIRAAAPSCYLCGFPALLRTIGPQDAEQNVFGQLEFGMDHADYLMMRAPTPILLCTATKDFFDVGGAWDVFRQAKRLYTRLGLAERIGILENDAEHNYNQLQREGVARWMSRWLLEKDQALVEPPIQRLSEKEFQCTPDGQVMRLPHARSVYDLNEDYERQLAPRRAATWKSADRAGLLAKVRQAAGIRTLEKLPKPQATEIGVVERPGCRIEKLLLVLEEGLALPALRFLPEKPKPGGAVLYVHEQGKAADASPGGPIDQLVHEGNTVLAVDLCGTGQTKPSGSEAKDVFTAYLLGRSYVGLRAENILVAARWAKEQGPAGSAGGIRLVAVGRAAAAALHAAALESGLFQSVHLVRSPPPWSGVVHGRLTRVQAAEVVHGALLSYDLPDLAAALGAKLVIDRPRQGTKPAPDLANVRYGPHERNVLDLWKANSDRPTPLVVFIHGGGFSAGSKEALSAALLNGCLRSGISVMAVNYRLSPGVSFPAHYMDCARAIQFARSKAKDWNLDPKRIGATGGSAGAGTSLWIGFHDDMADPASGDPVRRQSTRLACMAVNGAQSTYDPRAIKKLVGGRAHEHPALKGFYGLKDDELDTPRAYQLYEKAAPISYLTAGDPPVYAFYSEPKGPLPADAKPGQGIHHINFGASMKERMDALGIECVVRHSDDGARPDEEMVEFFVKHLRPTKPLF